MSESQTKTCQSCHSDFVIEPEDFGFYEKIGAQAPKNCWGCRFKVRAQFRNETTLYSRECNLCERRMVSNYAPTSPYVVYCDSCFESDSWDPLSYGREYDFKRPFFEQFRELLLAVPKKALHLDRSLVNVDSEYVNYAGGNKNCYLLFNSGYCEDTMYGRGLRKCRQAMDLYFSHEVENGYELISANNSSGFFGAKTFPAWLIVNLFSMEAACRIVSGA